MNESTIVNLLDTSILGKSFLGIYLRISQMLWATLPARITNLGPGRAYGQLLHSMVRMRRNRTFYFGTFFLRNRPQLELVSRLIGRESKASGLNISVLACSIGAEAYSLAWVIRSQHPGKDITINAIDISKDAVEFARRGVYPLAGSEFTDEKIFSRLTEREMSELFYPEGERMRIQNWIRESVTWHVGDAADPSLVTRLGSQDMVFANNFLCHMCPADAERCLRSLVGLVKRGGYLFVSGIDLDVRTKVVRDLKLEPVTELIEEIHEGDPALTKDWPFRYWGLEPFTRRVRDWESRYSSVYRVG